MKTAQEINQITTEIENAYHPIAVSRWWIDLKKHIHAQFSDQQGEGKPKWLTDLIAVRNKFYDAIPAGNVDALPAWEWIQLIKWHINDLDNLMVQNYFTPAPPIEPLPDTKPVGSDEDENKIADMFSAYWKSKEPWYFNEADFSTEEMVYHGFKAGLAAQQPVQGWTDADMLMFALRIILYNEGTGPTRTFEVHLNEYKSKNTVK